MNILFISSDNNATSGAFLSMVKLNELLQHNYGVNTKIILPKKGDGDKILIQKNIDFEYVKSFSWIIKFQNRKAKDWLIYILKLFLQIKNISTIFKIKKIIKNENIDIVHINTSFSYVAALAIKGTKARLIWHIREFLEEDRGLKIINRKLGYKIINNADKVVAISDSIYNKYLPIFGKSKIDIIYNGIDVKDYYYSHDALFSDNTIKMLIVGSVSAEKGQKDIVLAISKLKKCSKNIKLDIVGKFEDKSYKEELDEIILANELENIVTFYGKRSDVYDFQKKSDIVFVCSKSEAFGRVTVEAMMAGCLVIGANSAGTSEILGGGQYGLLYEFGNIDNLKSKIIYAVNNIDKMRCLAKLGQAHAIKMYSAEKNAFNVYETYKKLLK